MDYVKFDPGPVVMDTPIDGLKMDFNYGLRLIIPKGNFNIIFIDRDTDTILYNEAASNVYITSTKKYYVNFRVIINKDGKEVYKYDLDLFNKNVLIVFSASTIGDTIAWFPYVEEFRKKHKCNMYVSMDEKLSSIFRTCYSNITFINLDDKVKDCYATYYMGIFFPAEDRTHQPVDFRMVGLQRTIPYILGLPVEELKPKVKISKKRIIKEKYVCISVQATSQAKYWNNPNGWTDIVDYLLMLNYRVLCIDKEKRHGTGKYYNTIPYGAEDFTGDLPLQERIDLLAHADFFIGLSSGISWLAWASGIPVILISGFTLPYNEFYTPYRVINYHVCNGCWSDSKEEFDHTDFMWCPRHKNTDKEFECTKHISSGHVIQNINKLMKDYKLGI